MNKEKEINFELNNFQKELVNREKQIVGIVGIVIGFVLGIIFYCKVI